MENHIISSDDSLDILYMLTDSLDIVNERIDVMYAESVKPPAYMVAAAKRGLVLREKQPASNKCCLPAGLARARQLVNAQNLSLSTVKRIKSFASRHGANLKADTPNDSKLVQSLLLWGIPASKSGIERVIKWADAQINKAERAKKK